MKEGTTMKLRPSGLHNKTLSERKGTSCFHGAVCHACQGFRLSKAALRERGRASWKKPLSWKNLPEGRGSCSVVARYLVQQAVQATSAPCTHYLLVSLKHHVPFHYLRRPPKEVSHRKEADPEDSKSNQGPMKEQSLGTTVPLDSLEEGKAAEVPCGSKQKENWWRCGHCIGSVFHFFTFGSCGRAQLKSTKQICFHYSSE